MDIHDPTAEGSDDDVRNEPEIAGQEDHLDLRRTEHGEGRCTELGGVASGHGHVAHCDTRAFSASNRADLLVVHDEQARAPARSLYLTVEQGLEVGPRTRREDGGVHASSPP